MTRRREQKNKQQTSTTGGQRRRQSDQARRDAPKADNRASGTKPAAATQRCARSLPWTAGRTPAGAPSKTQDMAILRADCLPCKFT